MYAILKIHQVSLVLFKVMKLLKICMNIRAVIKLLYSELRCSWLAVQILRIFKVIIPIAKRELVLGLKFI